MHVTREAPSTSNVESPRTRTASSVQPHASLKVGHLYLVHVESRKPVRRQSSLRVVEVFQHTPPPRVPVVGGGTWRLARSAQRQFHQLLAIINDWW